MTGDISTIDQSSNALDKNQINNYKGKTFLEILDAIAKGTIVLTFFGGIVFFVLVVLDLAPPFGSLLYLLCLLSI